MKNGGSAFPDMESILGGIPIHQDSQKIILLTPNMSYKDWLIGQVLPEALRIVSDRINHTETGQDIIEHSLFLTNRVVNEVLAEREKQDGGKDDL